MSSFKFQHWKIALFTVWQGDALTFENSLCCWVTGKHSGSVAIGSRLCQYLQQLVTANDDVRLSLDAKFV